MNRENLEKWLVDLETTEEPQTRGVLTNRQGDCCLGRLCKVAIADGLNVNRGEDHHGNVHYDYACNTPPESVVNWLLGEHLIDGRDASLTDICTQKNDAAGLSFKEIAAWVREQYT